MTLARNHRLNGTPSIVVGRGAALLYDCVEITREALVGSCQDLGTWRYCPGGAARAILGHQPGHCPAVAGRWPRQTRKIPF
jgi:hypothetical protein